MPANRRNYYRILHVQPEAPPEVIRASWRALLGSARMHPDLGGEHEAAALINEAYAVLGDPARRRAYDRTYDPSRMRATLSRPAAAPAPGRTAGPAGPVRAGAPGPAASAAPVAGGGPDAWRAERRCPLCRAGLPVPLRADARCARCDAPLAPVPVPPPGERDAHGRRAARRRDRDDEATVVPAIGAPGIAARLVDLSMGGAALSARAPVAPGSVVRVLLPTLDAVARVVACEGGRPGWRLRVQWLSARPLASRGVYLAARA